MARCVAQSLCIALLLAVVNAQTVTTTCRPGGPSHLPHSVYAELFTLCDSAGNGFTTQCAPGTLYDDQYYVCVGFGSARNRIWPCDTARIGTKYPALCPENYFECTGSGFVKYNCTSGLNFDMNSRQCTQTQGVQHILCKRPGPNTGGCNMRVPTGGSNCFFQYTNEYNKDIFKCPDTVLFNETSCGCHDRVPENTCANATSSDISANKALDSSCRASFRLEFNSVPLTVRSDKLNKELQIYTNNVGVTVSNGRAIMRADPLTGAQSFIYAPFFAKNQLSTPLAFTFVYSLDLIGNTNQVQNQPVTIITNNYNNNCGPQVEVTVTYANGRHNINVNVTGGSLNGNVETTAYATTSGNIQGNPTDIIWIAVIFDKTIRVELSNRGQSASQTNSNIVTLPTTVQIGDYIKSNDCGFSFMQNLSGQVYKIAVHEGCSDSRVLRTVA